MRSITLTQSARTFVRVEGYVGLLSRTGKREPKGASLVVSEPMTMVYDHREQMAVYFSGKDGEDLFLLVSELGQDSFVQ